MVFSGPLPGVLIPQRLACLWVRVPSAVGFLLASLCKCGFYSVSVPSPSEKRPFPWFNWQGWHHNVTMNEWPLSWHEALDCLQGERFGLLLAPKTQQYHNRMHQSFFVTVIVMMPHNNTLGLSVIYESKHLLLRSCFCRLADVQPPVTGLNSAQLD